MEACNKVIINSRKESLDRWQDGCQFIAMKHVQYIFSLPRIQLTVSYIVCSLGRDAEYQVCGLSLLRLQSTPWEVDGIANLSL